ncbi:MAG: hypothetical protein IJK87_12245 [Prevotella sp.]|nr:hypothetical protein [Prevotella sp.]
MKRFTLFALLAIFTVTPLVLTGCDDDPWYDNYNWRNRNWYGRNDQGGNQGQGNNSIEDEGACLVGTWVGQMVYTYPDDKGNIGQAQFDAEMIFKLNSNNVYTEGVGTEIDRAGNDTQTLSFTWYIDRYGNIYVRYSDTGKTFMLDVESTTKGFYLDDSQFNGYMVAQKDVEEIEFSFTRGGNNNKRSPAKAKKLKTDTSNIPYMLVKR